MPLSNKKLYLYILNCVFRRGAADGGHDLPNRAPRGGTEHEKDHQHFLHSHLQGRRDRWARVAHQVGRRWHPGLPLPHQHVSCACALALGVISSVSKKRRVVEGLPRVVFKTREWFPFAVMTIQFSDESSRCSVLCQRLLLPHCPWIPLKSLTIPSNPCVYFKRKRLCQYRTRQVQIYNVDSTFFPRACILFMYLHAIYAQHWWFWIIIITLVCECDKIRFTVSCAIIVCDQFACSLDWTIIFNVQ